MQFLLQGKTKLICEEEHKKTIIIYYYVFYQYPTI